MEKGKVLRYVTGILLLFIGVGAVISGWALMQEPSGDSIELSLKLLRDSPFEDYFIPGLTLFAINGIGSLIGALFLSTNNQYSGMVTMILGAAMIIWIVFEMYWISEYSFLQPTLAAIGLLEIILGFFINRIYKQKPRRLRHPLKPRSPRAGM